MPQPPHHHPKINTNIHIIITQQTTYNLIQKHTINTTNHTTILFSLLYHNLNKNLTPKKTLPNHPKHKNINKFLTKKIYQQLHTPNPIKHLNKLITKYHTHYHHTFKLKPSTIIHLFKTLNIIKHPKTLTLFLLTYKTNTKNHTNFKQQTYPQTNYLQNYTNTIKQIKPHLLINLNFKKKTLNIKIKKKHINTIQKIKNNYIQN